MDLSILYIFFFNSNPHFPKDTSTMDNKFKKRGGGGGNMCVYY